MWQYSKATLLGIVGGAVLGAALASGIDAALAEKWKPNIKDAKQVIAREATDADGNTSTSTLTIYNNTAATSLNGTIFIGYLVM